MVRLSDLKQWKKRSDSDTSPTDYEQWAKLASVEPCTRRKERPDYVASVNGCGPTKSDPFTQAVIFAVQASGFISFNEACNNHDRCYGKCNNDKHRCDQAFREEMLEICSRKWGPKSKYPPKGQDEKVRDLYEKCLLAVGQFVWGIGTGGGHEAYWEAQKKACICCD